MRTSCCAPRRPSRTSTHTHTQALILAALIAPQIWAQKEYLLKDPVKYDVKYQGTAQPFLVFGILTTALAVAHHGGASL